MKISGAGLDIIKAQEGYLIKQDDGSCRAYLCPAGKWTCGWGCTEGVQPNTHWSEAEATAALAREMAKHEEHVLGLVKVPLTQGQFDALVSLCYNIGAGNFGKSTLLKHLNAGDPARAATHFADFKYARARGATARLYKVSDGTPVVMAGLVKRRAKETELFLADAAQPDPGMPQAVEPATPKWRAGEAFRTFGLLGASAGVGVGHGTIPAAPDLSGLVAWKGAVVQLQEVVMWSVGNLHWIGAAGGLYLVLGHGVPWAAKKFSTGAAA